jgi:hypothetical protein
MTVPSGADKVVWGNEVDFVGAPLANIDSLGFRVYQTGENAAINALNLPNVAIEIDSNGGSLQAGDYTTLNGVVDAAAPVNQWSAVTHTQFWMTGGVGTATGCNQTTYCSLADVEDKLPDATILSIGINKGRDNAWQGAVDGLGINADVYDFELPRTQVPVPSPPQVIIVGGVPTPTSSAVGASGSVDTVCKGASRRSIHASRRKGETFLSVRATLRGKRLRVSGRRISVDLRLRSEGHYDVRLVARYRKKSGDVRVVRTTRKLSVTCR